MERIGVTYDLSGDGPAVMVDEGEVLPSLDDVSHFEHGEFVEPKVKKEDEGKSQPSYAPMQTGPDIAVKKEGEGKFQPGYSSEPTVKTERKAPSLFRRGKHPRGREVYDEDQIPRKIQPLENPNCGPKWLELTRANEQLTNRIAQVAAARDGFESSNGVLKDDLERARIRENEHKRAIGDLTKELDNARTAAEKSGKVQIKLNDIQQRFNDLERANKLVEKQLVEAEAKAKVKIEDRTDDVRGYVINSYEVALRSSTGLFAVRREFLDELHEMVIKSRSPKEDPDLRQERDRLSGEVAQLKRDVQQLNADKLRVATEREFDKRSAEAEVKMKDTRITGLQAEAVRLREEKEAAQRELSKAQRDTRTAQDELQLAQDRAQGLDGKLRDANNRVVLYDASQLSVVRLENDNKAKQAEIDQHLTDIQDLRLTIRRKEADISDRDVLLQDKDRTITQLRQTPTEPSETPQLVSYIMGQVKAPPGGRVVSLTQAGVDMIRRGIQDLQNDVKRGQQKIQDLDQKGKQLADKANQQLAAAQADIRAQAENTAVVLHVGKDADVNRIVTAVRQAPPPVREGFTEITDLVLALDADAKRVSASGGGGGGNPWPSLSVLLQGQLAVRQQGDDIDPGGGGPPPPFSEEEASDLRNMCSDRVWGDICTVFMGRQYNIQAPLAFQIAHIRSQKKWPRLSKTLYNVLWTWKKCRSFLRSNSSSSLFAALGPFQQRILAQVLNMRATISQLGKPTIFETKRVLSATQTTELRKLVTDDARSYTLWANSIFRNPAVRRHWRYNVGDAMDLLIPMIESGLLDMPGISLFLDEGKSQPTAAAPKRLEFRRVEEKKNEPVQFQEVVEEEENKWPDSAPPGVPTYSYRKDSLLPDVHPLIKLILRDACPTKAFQQVTPGNADVHFGVGSAGTGRFQWESEFDRLTEVAALGQKLSFWFLLRKNNKYAPVPQFLPTYYPVEDARYQRLQAEKNAHYYTVDYHFEKGVANDSGINPETRAAVAKLVREKVCQEAKAQPRLQVQKTKTLQPVEAQTPPVQEAKQLRIYEVAGDETSEAWEKRQMQGTFETFKQQGFADEAQVMKVVTRAKGDYKQAQDWLLYPETFKTEEKLDRLQERLTQFSRETLADLLERAEGDEQQVVAWFTNPAI